MVRVVNEDRAHIYICVRMHETAQQNAACQQAGQVRTHFQHESHKTYASWLYLVAYCARCGQDGKGYLITLPRGWGSKIGMALKIGVMIAAAASDTGELADLPVVTCSGEESSAEWQGQVRFY